MSLRFVWPIALGLLLASASHSDAQVASTFDQLQLLVRAGDTVTVRDTAGTETTGKIDSLSSSSLLLASPGNRRELWEADVTSISQRRNDGLGNGALWGLAVGAAVGVVAALAMCYDGPCDASLVAVVSVNGGLGAGIGVGVDALITRRQVIFERKTGAVSFRVVPLLAPGRQGAALSVAF
jgi:hypothetical protein